MKNKGLTLIELAVATSILTIGIIAVLHSFLSVVSAFDVASDSIKALQYLETEMAMCQEKANAEGGVVLGKKEDKLTLDSRDCLIRTESLPLEELKNLAETRITLSWLRNNRENSREVVTYLKKKNEIPVE